MNKRLIFQMALDDFRYSKQNTKDYMNFVGVVHQVLRQGDGLLWSEIEEIVQMVIPNEYYYPKAGDQLSEFQPNLEYLKDDGHWVESGIIRSRLTHSLEGRYRVKIK